MKKRELVPSILIVFIAVSACTYEENVEITNEPQRSQFCTAMGCSDVIRLKILGETPTNYIARFTDNKGRVEIVHIMFENYSDKDYSVEYFEGGDEKIDQWRSSSPIFNACDSDISFFSLRANSDGNPSCIVAQCYGSPSKTAIQDTCYFQRKPREIMLTDYAPETVTVNVFWEGYSKTLTFSPTYDIFQPNGPDCPPSCIGAVLEFPIP